jgi:ABC-type transport system involved in multi-copper enzyme maturation permease subunit
MKYFAILKDSMREAVDSKVIYVTLALSVVLIVLVGSISYQPVAAQEALDTITGQFNLVYSNRGQGFDARYFFLRLQVKDLQEMSNANGPQGDGFRFTLVVGDPSQLRQAVAFWASRAAPGKGMEGDGDQVPSSLMEQFLKDQFELYGNVHIKVAPAEAQGPDLRFRVQTEGSRGVRGWLHDPCLFFGALPLRFARSSLGGIIYFIETTLVGSIGAWITIILGVVITAFFIPNMLRKGAIDLLLAKPVRRPLLLFYKYLGGLSFMFLNTVVAVGGVWLVLGLRSGIWAPGFLLVILVLTFFFAILYAVSTLFGVLTRSAVVAILVTCAVWFICWLAGTLHTGLEMVRKTPSFDEGIPNWVYGTVDTVHAVLPRTSDLNIISTRLVSDSVLTEAETRQKKLHLLPETHWGESLGVSGLFIAVMLGLASWRFSTRDY